MGVIDLTGQQYGRLTVLRIDPEHMGGDGNHAHWICQCSCGNIKSISSSALRRKHLPTRSCGCFTKERLTRHGKTKTRLYNVWTGMRERCYCKTFKLYQYYGRRGIKLCPEWESNYEAFEKWALANGYDETKPRGVCTVDRIDPNGDYSPENCRIVTMREQSNNRRNSCFVEYKGETHTLTEWCRILNLNHGTIKDRYNHGKRGEELFTPRNLKNPERRIKWN